MIKRIFIFVFPVLVVGVCLVIWRFPVRESETSRPLKTVTVPHASLGGTGNPGQFFKTSGSFMGRVSLLRYPIPNQRNVTSAESNAVRVAYMRILEAYTNRTVEVLRRRIDEMPDVVTNMQDQLYIELEMPLRSSFNDRFLWNQRILDFEESSEFQRYAEANLLVAKFLGNMVIRRGEGANGVLMVYDRNVLRQLKRYRDNFERGNRKNFVAVADRLIDDWIEQIDSEFGFTRWFMWHDLDNNWDHVVEGSMTRAKLLERTRSWARGLIKSGHTPKWIDEFRDGPDFKWKYLPPDVK